MRNIMSKAILLGLTCACSSLKGVDYSETIETCNSGNKNSCLNLMQHCLELESPSACVGIGDSLLKKSNALQDQDRALGFIYLSCDHGGGEYCSRFKEVKKQLAEQRSLASGNEAAKTKLTNLLMSTLQDIAEEWEDFLKKPNAKHRSRIALRNSRYRGDVDQREAGDIDTADQQSAMNQALMLQGLATGYYLTTPK